MVGLDVAARVGGDDGLEVGCEVGDEGGGEGECALGAIPGGAWALPLLPRQGDVPSVGHVE